MPGDPEQIERMFLPSIEDNPDAQGAYAAIIGAARAAGMQFPQIWHLFAYKPSVTEHLERFTQGVMRGPSPLSAGMRELIAAYTSARNHCPF